MKKAALIAALLVCPLVLSCAKRSWPAQGDTVFVSEELGPLDVLKQGPREHRGGSARACVPMRVITPKGEAARMVLEDDMGERHELEGDWTADILRAEKACLDAAETKRLAAESAARVASLERAEIDLASLSLTPEERRSFCVDEGRDFFLSLALPAALTSRADRPPLDACAQLHLCRDRDGVVIGEDVRGVYFRLEGPWTMYTKDSKDACEAARRRGPRPDVFVAYHFGKESIPYYKVAE